MERILRAAAAAFTGLCATALGTGLLASGAQAASVVVQQREPGPDLVAQRYAAPDSGNQTLTLVSAATPAASLSEWSTITALDFDRDGKPDAAVNMYYDDNAHDVVYQVRPVSASATGRDASDGSPCFAPIPGSTAPSGPALAGHTPMTQRTSTRVVSISVDFSTLPGVGGLARYQPIVSSFWTAGGNGLGGNYRTVEDWLPNDAGPSGGSDGECTMGLGGVYVPGYRLDPTKGTDRGQGASPTRTVPMPDRTGDVAAGETDLVETDVEQYTASQPAYDVTADTPSGSSATMHPADLVLRFGAGGGLSTTTYLNALGGAVDGTPDGLVTTSGASGADHVTVQIAAGLTGLSGSRCYPRDGATRLTGGQVWAASRVGSITLPVTTDPATGDRIVRIALDRGLGIYADNGATDRPSFSWLATSQAAGRADYDPDYAGQANGALYGACSFTGADGSTTGTFADPTTWPQVTAANAASLALAPAAPARGETVTLTASAATPAFANGYAFDEDGDGVYTTVSSTRTITHAYNARTQVFALAFTNDGTYRVAKAVVAPANPAPHAAIHADHDGPYALGPAGATVVWSDASTDDGLIASRHWTLTKGDQAIDGGTGETFAHTFAGGDDGHWTLTLSVTDDEGGTATATADVQVVTGAGDTGQATAARIARVSPSGTVYAGRQVVFSAASSAIRIGPARFAWDLDGDGTFETDTGAQATVSTTYAGAGHREVRVRITDGYGTVSASSPLIVDVGAPPTAAPTAVLNGPDVVSAGPGDGPTQATLDATGSAGNNADDRSVTYAWDLDGDGTYETDTGTTASVRATLPGPGDHVVRLRVTDAFGNRATASRSIFVRGSAEVAHDCTGREQYRSVAYGPARVAGCWTAVTRPSTGTLWIARGTVSLNGLLLQKGSRGTAPKRAFADCSGTCTAAQAQFNDASQGQRIALDPSDGSLVSNGPVAVHAYGSGADVLLNDGPLDVTLPTTTKPTEKGVIFHPPGGANLFFLRVADDAEVRFPEDGAATASMSVELPEQMPGASGDVTLRSTETQGVVLDHLKVGVQTGVLSDYLKLGSLSLEYDRAGEQWTGAAELGLPAIKGKEFELGVEISIAKGKFKSIYGSVDGLDVSLGEGIFLQRLRAGVGVDPLDLQGGMGISAGPKILGTELFSADGDLRVTFPSASAPYTLFQISAVTKLLDQFDLQRGVLRFATNGFFEARGGITRTVGGIGYFDADIGGWFTPGKANLSGDAEAGIKILGTKYKLAGAHAVLSTRGVAACGEVPVIDVSGGLGYRWGGKFNVFTGCDLGPYSEDRPAGIPEGFSVRAAAAATRAPALKLQGGLRSVTVAVHGRGAAPKVKLVDAAGRVVVDATREQLTTKAMVLMDADSATTQILVKRPAAGRYLVVPAEGSAAVTRVEHAVDAGPRKVTARVSGSGARRTVRWTVTPTLEKGQQLTLGEAASVDGAGDEILTTTRSSGSQAFTPSEGHGERRVVTATIVTDGLAGRVRGAGRFSAPRTARPAQPSGVALRRQGRTVTLSWKAGSAPAGGWRVTVAAGSLRNADVFVSGSRRSYVLRDVPVQLAVDAKVAGLGSGRAPGAAGHAALAAGAARSGVKASAAPRAVKLARHGRRLTVTWSPGSEAVRRFAVRVTVGSAKPVLLYANGAKRSVTLSGLPARKVAVTAQVRAERYDGKLSAAARGSRGV